MLESLSQDAAYDSGGKLFGQKVNRLWFDQIILDHWETFPAFLPPGFLPPISGFFLVADHSAGREAGGAGLDKTSKCRAGEPVQAAQCSLTNTALAHCSGKGAGAAACIGSIGMAPARKTNYPSHPSGLLS